jgi:hypothetical protein
MRRERVLKFVLVLVGLLFTAAIYPAIQIYGIGINPNMKLRWASASTLRLESCC